MENNAGSGNINDTSLMTRMTDNRKSQSTRTY